MTEPNPMSEQAALTASRQARAAAIAGASGIENALDSGALARRVDITLSEAIVLGLLRQNVSNFLCVLGHGATEVAEVLRIYQEAGLVKAYALRSEIEASHAATALRWVTGEKAAVVTSIGPGALHALAASLAPASDGLGVWYLFGDETTEDEGPNMQQVPSHEQHGFLRLCSAMGKAYTLHTPLAVSTALRRGMNTVDHPHRAGPFYLLMPMNTQANMIKGFNLDELPNGAPPPLGEAADNGSYAEAIDAISQARKVVVRVGGGARDAGPEIERLLEATDGVAVTSPLVSGVITYDHPRNMTVGGSKGSLSGNYAMENADLLIAVGSRFVCQSDCSRTGYPNVEHVININTDAEAATHYSKTTAMVGNAAATVRRLIDSLLDRGDNRGPSPSEWLTDCAARKRAWDEFKEQRYQTPKLLDPMWGREVLTQPAAIKSATDWARDNDVVTFFDAGDAQANGFQIVEDDVLGRTFTETGASYMGFAVSALLSTTVARRRFYGLAITGDGSFTMNPQILIDGVEHGASGCILLLDNRRMAAIAGLQIDQYGSAYAANDSVAVDYVEWAQAVSGVRAFRVEDSIESLVDALREARSYHGLSLIHVPVYFGPDEFGGMGVFGRWNVGNWGEQTQAMRHDIGL